MKMELIAGFKCIGNSLLGSSEGRGRSFLDTTHQLHYVDSWGSKGDVVHLPGLGEGNEH